MQRAGRVEERGGETWNGTVGGQGQRGRDDPDPCAVGSVVEGRLCLCKSGIALEQAAADANDEGLNVVPEKSEEEER